MYSNAQKFFLKFKLTFTLVPYVRSFKGSKKLKYYCEAEA